MSDTNKDKSNVTIMMAIMDRPQMSAEESDSPEGIIRKRLTNEIYQKHFDNIESLQAKYVKSQTVLDAHNSSELKNTDYTSEWSIEAKDMNADINQKHKTVTKYRNDLYELVVSGGIDLSIKSLAKEEHRDNLELASRQNPREWKEPSDIEVKFDHVVMNYKALDQANVILENHGNSVLNPSLRSEGAPAYDDIKELQNTKNTIEQLANRSKANFVESVSKDDFKELASRVIERPNTRHYSPVYEFRYDESHALSESKVINSIQAAYEQNESHENKREPSSRSEAGIDI